MCVCVCSCVCSLPLRVIVKIKFINICETLIIEPGAFEALSKYLTN